MTVRDLRGKHLFLTGSTDIRQVRRIVSVLKAAAANGGANYAYQINSATLDEVFIDLNAEKQAEPNSSSATLTPAGNVTSVAIVPITTPVVERDLEKPVGNKRESEDTGLVLTPGKKPSYIPALFVDAFTIFVKRFIVLRRSWLLPIIGMIVAIAASCIPLFFMKDRVQTCAFVLEESTPQSITYPYSYYPAAFTPVVLAPQALGDALSAFPGVTNASNFIRPVTDNASFVDLFNADYTRQTFGGVSLGSGSTPSLFAYEGSTLSNKGLSALNLLTNIQLDQIAPDPASPFRINLTFRFLASPDFGSTAQAFKWLAFVSALSHVWI